MRFLTIFAEPGQLQPVTGHFISKLLADLIELFFHFKPVKITAGAAIGANQQMLMMIRTAEYGLAFTQVVHVVDQVQLLKFFDGAVYRYQADA